MISLSSLNPVRQKEMYVSFSRVSIGVIYFIIIADYISGFLTDKHVFDRLLTLYFATLLLLLIGNFTFKKINRHHVYVMTGAILFMILSILSRHSFSGSTISAFFLDIQYSTRSILLMFLTINLFASFHSKKNLDYLKSWALFQWVFITIMISLHIFADLGGDVTKGSDVIKRGYFAFFSSGNQLVAIYIVSWWCLSLFFRFSLAYRVMLAAATLLIVFATGSRSAVVLILAMSIFSMADDQFMKNRIFGIFIYTALAVSFVFVFMNLEVILFTIMDIFIQYSSEGEKISSKLDRIDIVTIAFSGRDIHIQNAIEAFKSYSIGEWIFGVGIHDFSYLLGSFSYAEEHTMAENDFVDILGAYGIIGILLHYGITLYVLIVLYRLRLSSSVDSATGKLLAGGIVTLFLFSILTGHIYLSPFTSIILGMLSGMVISLTKMSEDNSLITLKNDAS